MLWARYIASGRTRTRHVWRVPSSLASSSAEVEMASGTDCAASLCCARLVSPHRES